ncbi:MAG TPA: SPOR domain-containing protein [Usitatibacter sp.]|nr:SPOR domain-containing protein [Usitatibacter sp.]
MSRLIFFLLLIAAIAFGFHVWLTAKTETSDYSAREKNRDEVRLVAVTSSATAARNAEDARRTMQSLAGSACVEFSGIAAADAQRARDAFNTLQLGTRLAERRVEEITRYWVFIASVRDRKTAETTMANLRKQGVNDMSIRPDNAISLGVFSTEEAARRFMTSLEAKGVKGAEAGPFAKEMRELVMLIREPDTETVARLTILQREYPGAQLRAVTCPAA